MNNKLLVCLIFLNVPVLAAADYRDDIGFTDLQQQLGNAIPDGAGINVAQVEAATGTNNDKWMPDVASSQFSTKTIADETPASNGVSGHATGVANLFYGNTSSMASGITDISVYSALPWIGNSFLNTDSNAKPKTSAAKITNHSWIGSINDTNRSLGLRSTSNALRRTDWLVETHEAIQVVGMSNGSGNQPLLGSAYNVIAVGRTDGLQGIGSVALDSVYSDNRSRPDIVAPLGVTSSTTPVVAAAAAMLVDQAQTQASVNGDRSEVIKAVVMAGADRQTHNTNATKQISDYRNDVANQTANGLDIRFGAGQLNVYNNYYILAAGEQDSLQDGGGPVDRIGFDYDASFGGANGSNTSASYFFSTEIGQAVLAASLVWNIDIEGGNGASFDEAATLHNLDLELYDVTGSSAILYTDSTGIFDNSENIWVTLDTEKDYELRVVAAGSAFDWDYAVAWQVTQVPVPGAVWLFASGLLGLFSLKRKKSSNVFEISILNRYKAA